MKTPIPSIHETPEELKGLLKTERDAQKQRRLQALYCLQSQQVRTRRQVARRLGSVGIPSGAGWRSMRAAASPSC